MLVDAKMFKRIFMLAVLASPLSVTLAEPFTAGLTALSREHATTAFRAWMKVAEQAERKGRTMLVTFMKGAWV